MLEYCNALLPKVYSTPGIYGRHVMLENTPPLDTTPYSEHEYRTPYKCPKSSTLVRSNTVNWPQPLSTCHINNHGRPDFIKSNPSFQHELSSRAGSLCMVSFIPDIDFRPKKKKKKRALTLPLNILSPRQSDPVSSAGHPRPATSHC